MDKRFQVFVSSTYADLKEERSIVMRTIMSLNCIPAGMELFPASNAEQFEFIKRVIDDCDYYILIVGGRYGSLTEEGISYTEKEFAYAKQKGLPILAFLHNDLESIPLGKSEKEPAQRARLIQFREKVATGRLIQFWNTPEDLSGKVATSLSLTIMQSPAVGWVRANLQSTAESLQQENQLRKELAELKEYVIRLEKERNEAIELKDLASLEDMFTLRFSHVRWSASTHKDIHSYGELNLPWSSLFAAISPRLMNSPNEDKVRSIIGDVIGEKKEISHGRISPNNEDFDTIKIQLIALELIKVQFLKTVGGGMALFWTLTSKGQKLMMQLRTVVQ